MTNPITVGDLDITEKVQILYDIAHTSLDFGGSGFLSSQETREVVELAIIMGWQVPILPDNSPAMQAIAAEYPEHYAVEYRRLLGGRLAPHIQRSAPGGWSSAAGATRGSTSDE